MKKFLLSVGLILSMTAMVNAQSNNYKVVFDMSSRDTVNQQTIVREIALIKGSNPNAKLEVVVFGQGLDLVIKGRSAQESTVEKLIADGNATFKVCAMSLGRNHILKDQLLTGVEIVPDGIYEIISKQQEGWGYIKVGH